MRIAVVVSSKSQIVATWWGRESFLGNKSSLSIDSDSLLRTSHQLYIFLLKTSGKNGVKRETKGGIAHDVCLCDWKQNTPHLLIIVSLLKRIPAIFPFPASPSHKCRRPGGSGVVSLPPCPVQRCSDVEAALSAI